MDATTTRAKHIDGGPCEGGHVDAPRCLRAAQFEIADGRYVCRACRDADAILEIAATIRANVDAWWNRRIDQETFDLCQTAAWGRATLQGISDEVATWLWQNPPAKTETGS